MDVLHSVRKGEDSKIPYDTFKKIESIARVQWERLSDKERGMFLTTDFLVRLRELYPERLDRADDDAIEIPASFPRLKRLLHDVIFETSAKNIAIMKPDLIEHMKRFPKMRLGIIEKWFPQMAKEVEEEARKPIWKKVTTLFQRPLAS